MNCVKYSRIVYGWAAPVAYRRTATPNRSPTEWGAQPTARNPYRQPSPSPAVQQKGTKCSSWQKAVRKSLVVPGVTSRGAGGVPRRPAVFGRQPQRTHGTRCMRGEKKNKFTMLFENPNAKLFPGFNMPPPVRLRWASAPSRILASRNTVLSNLKVRVIQP